MKRALSIALVSTALALVTAVCAVAAPALPQVSPAATVGQVVGVTKVEISYHRPAVKGRAIWGGLVPYGQVWRLGANDATTISFSDAVKVAGKDVAAGRYALFAIPTADKWTFILNKTADQWGAYQYKTDQDALRFEAKPEACGAEEWMRFTIAPTGPDSAAVEVAWEKLCVRFPVAVDTPTVLWKQIDDALAAKADDADALAVAARYSMASGQRQADAAAWVAKAISSKETFGLRELQADILHRAGRDTEALLSLAKARDLATTAKAPPEYFAGLDKKAAEWQAAPPKKN